METKKTVWNKWFLIGMMAVTLTVFNGCTQKSEEISQQAKFELIAEYNNWYSGQESSYPRAKPDSISSKDWIEIVKSQVAKQSEFTQRFGDLKISSKDIEDYEKSLDSGGIL